MPAPRNQPRPEETTLELIKEVVRQVSLLFKETGDLINDTADLSQAISNKEGNHRFKQALRIVIGQTKRVTTSVTDVRRNTWKLKSKTATELEIDIFNE